MQSFLFPRYVNIKVGHLMQTSCIAKLYSLIKKTFRSSDVRRDVKLLAMVSVFWLAVAVLRRFLV
jgi:hypothetical protein